MEMSEMASPSPERPPDSVQRLSATLARKDAEAVMLDLMQPLAAGRSVLVGRHGVMNPAGKVRCNMWTE